MKEYFLFCYDMTLDSNHINPIVIDRSNDKHELKKRLKNKVSLEKSFHRFYYIQKIYTRYPTA